MVSYKKQVTIISKPVYRSKWFGDFLRYFIVIIFAAAAILTPPDPVTQIGLAIPLLLLYELSIISVKIIENKIKEKEKENA